MADTDPSSSILRYNLTAAQLEFFQGSDYYPVPGMASGITTLTGDVTAGPGSGSQVATIATLSHDLDLGTHALINVLDPTDPQDAATKNYVDTNFISSSSNPVNITNDIDMHGNHIVNLDMPGSPSPNDAVNKDYVDTNFLSNTANPLDINFDIDLHGNHILHLDMPVSPDPNDAANRDYVDTSTVAKVLPATNLDTAGRDALTPAAGWIIFNTDLTKLQVYNGTTWETITSA